MIPLSHLITSDMLFLSSLPFTAMVESVFFCTFCLTTCTVFAVSPARDVKPLLCPCGISDHDLACAACRHPDSIGYLSTTASIGSNRSTFNSSTSCSFAHIFQVLLGMPEQCLIDIFWASVVSYQSSCHLPASKPASLGERDTSDFHLTENCSWQVFLLS